MTSKRLDCLCALPSLVGDAMAMAMSLRGGSSAAMQSARRAPTHMPALLLQLLRRSSSSLAAFPALPWPRSDRIRMHDVNARKNLVVPSAVCLRSAPASFAGQTVAWVTVIGLPSRLGCSRQQLQYGQQCRSLLLVTGVAVQDVCAIKLFRSLWPTPVLYPGCFPPMEEVSVDKSGVHHHRQFGRDQPRLPLLQYVAADSGDALTIEELWEEYFADPSQWWDNRVDKVAPGISTRGILGHLT